MIQRNQLKRSALALAIAVATSGAVFAQSNTNGYIFGQVSGTGTVSIENTATGLKREVAADADGNFRASSLPTGKYTVTFNGQTRNVSVNVGTGSNVSFASGDATALEGVVVEGQGIAPIDLSSTESSTILVEETLDAIPTARNVTGVALLAPGTTQGDSAFGNLASFGGSTVGENAYYINGFNVTNFSNGLGGSTVPFEFYSEFQVKTGGYGAEFGRSTGGVINAVTKRGSNDWKFGGNIFYTPDSLRGDGTNTLLADGSAFVENEEDEADALNANFYASGPIIEDRLFFFALVNPRDNESDNYTAGGVAFNNQSDDAFWGAKIDWNITDNHIVEVTGFSDSDDTATTQYSYNADTNTRGAVEGAEVGEAGGKNIIAKYTGYLTDSFTLSALYGNGEYSRSTIPTNAASCPIITDIRSGVTQRLGCWSGGGFNDQTVDERTAYRIDAEWALGNHQVRFGYDNENNEAGVDSRTYSGAVGSSLLDPNVPVQGIFYRYARLSSGAELVRLRQYQLDGTYTTETDAMYIEDNWQISDSLLVSLGVRSESFNNLNGLNESFIKIDNQLAPRLGLSWDVMGNGESKFFANYGRYFLPVANNTNQRLAGNELFLQQNWNFSGINADGTPILTTPRGGVTILANGETKDTRSVVDSDIDAMYQDEFLIGYQQQVFEGWSVGFRGIHRDLKSTLEDMAVDAALNSYAADNGYDDFEAGGFDFYVLGNPGQDITMFVDMDGDGALELVELSASRLGYPESTRKYNAGELFFERAWDGNWFLQGSWTISHSYGNNEGYVRSDNGQDDAGLTTLFDQPGLTDGAYGDLPNDRRHKFKLFGSYKLADEWTMGGNFALESGRPINCFGVHPTDEFAQAYGHEAFYCGLREDASAPLGLASTLVPRGSIGRTDWTRNLDLSVEYRPGALDGKMGLKAEIFNVFDAQSVKEVVETGETDDGFPEETFLLPSGYQAPRAVRFSLSYDF